MGGSSRATAHQASTRRPHPAVDQGSTRPGFGQFPACTSLIDCGQRWLAGGELPGVGHRGRCRRDLSDGDLVNGSRRSSVSTTPAICSAATTTSGLNWAPGSVPMAPGHGVQVADGERLWPPPSAVRSSRVARASRSSAVVNASPSAWCGVCTGSPSRLAAASRFGSRSAPASTRRQARSSAAVSITIRPSRRPRGRSARSRNARSTQAACATGTRPASSSMTSSMTSSIGGASARSALRRPCTVMAATEIGRVGRSCRYTTCPHGIRACLTIATPYEMTSSRRRSRPVVSKSTTQNSASRHGVSGLGTGSGTRR